MDAYIYQAALYCEDCITKLKTGSSTWEPVKGLLPEFVEVFKRNPAAGPAYKLVDGVICQEVRHAPLTCPVDPADETTYDSDDYPKGPYPDGGGESDSPENCDGCHVFLENPLTSEGVEQVLVSAEEEFRRGPAEYNRIMPAKGTGEDSPDFARWHGQPHKAIVIEWLEHIADYGLSGADSKRLNAYLSILRDGKQRCPGCGCFEFMDEGQGSVRSA